MPPCSAARTTVLVRLDVPFPQLALHVPYSDQGETTQSTGQGSGLHVVFRVMGGHVERDSCHGGGRAVDMLRTSRTMPPPHLTLQPSRPTASICAESSAERVLGSGMGVGVMFT